MCIWNKDGRGLGDCWMFQNVFFHIFLVIYQKYISFYCLKSITGCLLFGDICSTSLMKIQKCDFGAHPKYWKNVRFYKHFSLGPGRCCHFGGFPKNDFYSIFLLCISKKHQFLLSRLPYWAAPFFDVFFWSFSRLLNLFTYHFLGIHSFTAVNYLI